jgi:hypothetical protein
MGAGSFRLTAALQRLIGAGTGGRESGAGSALNGPAPAAYPGRWRRRERGWPDPACAWLPPGATCWRGVFSVASRLFLRHLSVP